MSAGAQIMSAGALNVDEAVAFVRSRCNVTPIAAIILGSGLGRVADKIQDATSIPFADIPGFAASTAGGHRGQLILGTLEGRPVVAMAGRFHRYEGHSRSMVTFPVCVMQRLGATTLLVSNAAGGLNPSYGVGDLVVIEDHIDWLGGGVMAIVGPKMVGITHRHGRLYDHELGDLAVQAGCVDCFAIHRGTYLATLGPNYETRAEYRMMRNIGADLAGMSTVPEALQGRALGMRVVAISMVSNVANPDAPEIANHAEVLLAGEAAAAKMESVARHVLRGIPS